MKEQDGVAARLVAWQNEQNEIGAEIYDEDLNLTLKEIAEMFIHEYRKLDWYDEDGFNYDSSKLSYYFDSNVPGSFCLEFKYINEEGEEDTNSDDTCHMWDYDDEEYLIMRFSQIQYPTVFKAMNPRTNKEGLAALRDVVIDLRHYKKRREQNIKIKKLLSDEDFMKED